MAKNIILVGMPGSGKSTLGVLLAKALSYRFLDTDALIEQRQGRTLQDIVDREGYLALRKIEEELLLSLRLERHVVATGGSAVYSPRAMAHLKENGIIVFLHVELESLKKRIHNFGQRGIAKRPGQTFEALFRERLPLYHKVADLTCDNTRLSPEEACGDIIGRLSPLLASGG